VVIDLVIVGWPRELFLIGNISGLPAMAYLSTAARKNEPPQIIALLPDTGNSSHFLPHLEVARDHGFSLFASKPISYYSQDLSLNILNMAV